MNARTKAFLAHNPTLIGTVNGDSFYEHPLKGDDAPLVIVSYHGNVCYNTEWWELPSSEEYNNDCVGLYIGRLLKCIESLT